VEQRHDVYSTNPAAMALLTNPAVLITMKEFTQPRSPPAMTSCIRAIRLIIAFAASTTLAELPSEEAILKAGGGDASAIIQKARTTLSLQKVFGSRGVGYGGRPTSGCWALTVIVRHDKEAKEIFHEIYRLCDEPAAKLYAMAGLLILDPQSKKDFTPEKLGKLAELEVERLDGCIGTTSTLGAVVAELIELGAARYTYEKLPSIYQTADCTKTSHAQK